MLRSRNSRWGALALSAVLVVGAAASADVYFEIRTMSEWDEALATGHVVPFTTPQWDQYFDEWLMFTEEGDPYPPTQFIEPVLYPYEGPEVPPDPNYPGGLVMAWGDENLPDGQFASAWQYDYLVDPDLSNAIITLTVFPPQFGQNGGITQISFGIQDLASNTRSWYWNVGPGTSIPWNVPTPITIDCTQTGLGATTPAATGYMSNPAFNIAMVQWFIADENGLIVGGQVPAPPPGGPPAAVWNYWYDIVVQPKSGGSDYMFEFSLDIGSDIELSDPFVDGDEAADPGDVYWWQSAPIVPPGRDGFKDDLFIFNFDPWPDPPDPNLSTAVPVGFGSIQDYFEWFDLDGHDQLDFSLLDIQLPYPHVQSQCVHFPDHVLFSFEDDQAPGWPVADVPVNAFSPAGVTHGTTAGQDEILGLDVMIVPGPPPYPIMNVYPFADERTVHPSMAPNPDFAEEDDDDVDSLDIVENEDGCPIWTFSADHEANLNLDPGDIYEVTAFGPVLVVDEVFHLGMPDEVDVDAFEFVWAENPEFPGTPMLAVLFSVDEDDPLTPNANESGGFDPSQVFISWLLGWSMPFTDPLGEDVDALTVWRESLEPQQPTGACCTAGICTITTQAACIAGGGYYKGDNTICTANTCVCRGDANCDGLIDFGDINPFVAALLSGTYCDGTGANADVNGNGSVGFDDINPFVALLTTNPLPIVCP